MPAKIDLTNINMIGTPTSPVQSICVQDVIVLGTVSYSGPTLVGTPPVETKHGINFNSGTGKLELNDNISTAVTFDSTIGVTGTATMAAITASGVITANGGLTLGANMTTGAYWIRGSGANVGMKFTGENVEFSGTMSIGGLLTCVGNIKLSANYISYGGTNAGMSLNSSNNALFSGTVTVAGDTYCQNNCDVQGTIYSVGNIISTSGYIRSSNSYIEGTKLLIDDGIAVPALIGGMCQIFVDTADGDLKYKKGDGTLRVISYT